MNTKSIKQLVRLNLVTHDTREEKLPTTKTSQKQQQQQHPLEHIYFRFLFK